MTRSGGKAGPVPDNGTVDGAPGRRRTLSPEGSRVAPDARRVRTTPAKRVSPALWRRPGAPFPFWGNGKREAGVSRADQRTGRAECWLDAQIIDQPGLAELGRDQQADRSVLARGNGRKRQCVARFQVVDDET